MAFELREALPDRDALFALFETTGWNRGYRLTPGDLHEAASRSWFAVAAWDGDRLVGFGRVISDGVMHALVTELIVVPDRQRAGIGRAVLERLVERCRAQGVRDVQLFCAPGKRAFYERQGFVARDAEAPGMQLRARAW